MAQHIRLREVRRGKPTPTRWIFAPAVKQKRNPCRFLFALFFAYKHIIFFSEKAYVFLNCYRVSDLD